MAIVTLQHVIKEYRLGDHMVRALDDVSLTVDAGAFLAIAGPSGSGKSTVLNIIGCIDTATSGRVTVAGHDVSGQTPDQLASLRARTIGFIFQTFNLLPVLSAEENVEYPLLQMSEIGRKERRDRVQQMLDVVNLSKFAKHRPNQLSGGQRQRVAIARALVTHPAIVLADEPTANLDHKTGEGILTLMRDINRHLKTTFIFSTHDKKVIDSADRLIGIEDGRIRLVGTRKDGQWDITSLRRTSATPSPAPTPASRKATRIMGNETGLMGTHTELMATRPERTS
jgi:putative ABC transport system ATP-binding protein